MNAAGCEPALLCSALSVLLQDPEGPSRGVGGVPVCVRVLQLSRRQRHHRSERYGCSRDCPFPVPGNAIPCPWKCRSLPPAAPWCSHRRGKASSSYRARPRLITINDNLLSDIMTLVPRESLAHVQGRSSQRWEHRHGICGH